MNSNRKSKSKSAIDEDNNNKKLKKKEEEEEKLLCVDDKDKEKEYKCRWQVVKRRSKRLKQLSKVYRDYYWCLIEDLKLKHTHFLWNFATTPYLNNNNNNNNINTINGVVVVVWCEVHSCKNKPMALTRFCHSHILSDSNQLLYKPCNYPTKSSPSGPTLCMKPILKSAVPSLCSNHFDKADKHFSRCLRNQGFTATNKYPPKFNVLVSEFVRQIQSNRKQTF